MNNRTMYEGSDGTIMPISEVHTERLINSLSKCHREIYNSKTTDEFNKYINKITNIDIELTKRMKTFYEKLTEVK